MITITNEDNMKLMARYPNGFFDLAIVDPPYGIGTTRHNNTHRSRKNRLSTGGGKLKNSALQTFNSEWDNNPPKTEYFNELFRVSKNQIIWGGNYFELPATRCVICWDKLQPWDNFSKWEMAWTSFDMPAKLIRLSNTGGANTEKKIHPTQKPVKLYKWLLNQFANAGDHILDTHLGGG